MADARVLHESRPLGIASRIIRAGERVTLLSSEAEVPLLHLDREIAVIDKPDALPSQPSPGSSNPSALEVLAAQLKRMGETSELYIVHRLDTNTTGVLAFARSRKAADVISTEIRERAEKRYLAIVRGSIKREMVIDAPISRLEGNVFHVAPEGKASRSVVRPLHASIEASLVEVEIKTGRTHQIRIHLAHAGHPVLGDQKYGSVHDTISRPMLHALSLRLPERALFTAPLPKDFMEAATQLGLPVAEP